MDKSTIKDALKKVLAEKGNYTSLYSLESDTPVKREIKRIKIVSKTPPKQPVTKKDVESAQEVTKVETKKAIKTEVETITKQLDIDLTEKARLIKGEIHKDITQAVTALVGTLAEELTAKLPTEMVMTEAQRQSIVDETALSVESQITSILAEYVAEIETQSIPGLAEYITSFLPDLTALQVDWSQIRNVPNLGGTNTNIVRQIVAEALANAGGGGGGHTIEDEGTPLTQRTTMNFVGAGVTVTDVGSKTVVTIPSRGMAIGDTITSATAGSVLFAGVAGVLAQNNSDFRWDNTLDRLILTNTDGLTRTKTLLNLVNDVGNANIAFPYGGGITIGWDGLFMAIPNIGTFSVSAASTIFPSGSFQLDTQGAAEIFSGASSGNTFRFRGPGAMFFNTWTGSWTDKMVITQAGLLGVTTLSPVGQIHSLSRLPATPASVFQGAASQTADLTQWQDNAETVLAKVAFDGVMFPRQATTASAPTYVLGGMYFDTTLNKLRIGGVAGWETVTSV